MSSPQIEVNLVDYMGSDSKTKKCRGCLDELPLQAFPARKDRGGRPRPYCKTCVNEIERVRYEHHKRTEPFKHRCTRARSRAKGLEVNFSLSPEYLESIWTGVCPVRGVKLNLNTDRTDEDAAELDRFYPEVGYVEGNVHWLSRKANRLKNNVNLSELRNLLEWMESVESN